MPLRRSVNALAVLGIGPEEEALYRSALPFSGETVAAVASRLDVAPADLTEQLATLTRLGMVRLQDGRFLAYPPATAVADYLGEQSAALHLVARRLEGLVTAMPGLRDVFPPEPAAGGEALRGEVRSGGDVPGLLESWIRNGSGDLLWFRSDQWRLPHEPVMTALVAEAIARGRRSLAVYPAAILDEAPGELLARAEAGEEIRVVAELPSRMAIIEGSGVLLPEHWGRYNDRRIIVQEPGLVDALRTLFLEVWQRAIVVPGLPQPGAHDTQRRLLLEQLSAGARDEQIAATLGLSLRTVRRRVADLLDELGVTTRFQAGVEAVRRGWL